MPSKTIFVPKEKNLINFLGAVDIFYQDLPPKKNHHLHCRCLRIEKEIKFIGRNNSRLAESALNL